MVKAKVREEYDDITVTEWEAPEESGVPIITMPNIPKPLHGKGCQPRTIYGATVWDFMRKKCYMDAGWKCEVCGVEPPKGGLHAHELFSYDYKKHTATFVRCVALCEKCHIRGIHSGRMLTMFKLDNGLMPAYKVLEGVENVFSLVSKYNKEHPVLEPLRVFDTFLDYLDDPVLGDDVKALIKKYGVKFYGIDEKKDLRQNWGKWKVIVDGKAYKTPYKTIHDWELAMAEQNKVDEARQENPFSGEVYDELEKLLTNE